MPRKERERERERADKRARKEGEERDRAARRGKQHWASEKASIVSVIVIGNVVGGRERENCSIVGE